VGAFDSPIDAARFVINRAEDRHKLARAVFHKWIGGLPDVLRLAFNLSPDFHFRRRGSYFDFQFSTFYFSSPPDLNIHYIDGTIQVNSEIIMIAIDVLDKCRSLKHKDLTTHAIGLRPTPFYP
jgi:hypothetical protein